MKTEKNIECRNLGTFLRLAAQNIDGINQQILAQRFELSQGAISNLITGTRPKPESLKLITSPLSWPENKRLADRALIEHLRDEVVRAGHNLKEINITENQGRSDLGGILSDIKALSSINPEILEPLGELIQQIRNSFSLAAKLETEEEEDGEPELLVAEATPAYYDNKPKVRKGSPYEPVGDKPKEVEKKNK